MESKEYELRCCASVKSCVNTLELPRPCVSATNAAEESLLRPGDSNHGQHGWTTGAAADSSAGSLEQLHLTSPKQRLALGDTPFQHGLSPW